jgi:hypothetical protein
MPTVVAFTLPTGTRHAKLDKVGSIGFVALSVTTDLTGEGPPAPAMQAAKPPPAASVSRLAGHSHVPPPAHGRVRDAPRILCPWRHSMCVDDTQRRDGPLLCPHAGGHLPRRTWLLAIQCLGGFAAWGPFFPDFLVQKSPIPTPHMEGSMSCRVCLPFQRFVK